MTMQSIDINLDDSILLALKETKEKFSEDMRFYTAMVLYKKNRLSLGKSALLANMDKLDFIDKLAEEEIDIFDYDDKTLQDIFQDAKGL